jgi:hypothetical protein
MSKTTKYDELKDQIKMIGVMSKTDIKLEDILVVGKGDGDSFLKIRLVINEHVLYFNKYKIESIKDAPKLFDRAFSEIIGFLVLTRLEIWEESIISINNKKN